ncbi:hypothetical protein M501DRAFT_1057378 [Patellaria atrata CBS 101060]|uniref:Cell polarity protein n=1 Tax=Patellaria atrata CBS 101060 TaxID=1346257 RepID=A0A9P4SAR1_9PEZI|nr:hypothetical protein M501DRAFT_1057378 [Patellaria atrata CBS 101060]
MSFLFKSKKHQHSALPAASRDLSSAHGHTSQIPTVNGFAGRGDAVSSPAPNQTPTPGSSVNNSLNSLQGALGTASPDPTKGLRGRADSELQQNGRNGGPARGPADSPYPWAQLRLNFTSPVSPFPRYGAAVNAVASKDGSIYMMGGLINGSTVKGDLWMVESTAGSMSCYQVATTSEGPGPRVGHASLLVGNAFIVFGGDTKVDDGDVLDDTLYLLNTSTKQWSRALPAGPRPSGRYGHTLNILGSKIYIFGGQVERDFYNDLIAFDLNALQTPSNRWEVLIPNSREGYTKEKVPPARTNHSIVTWNDRIYLFGGTDGVNWFNDVWTYDPRTNKWEDLDCIGYIPFAREGHAAAIVGDTMYVFGGRTKEGNDLGDLAAFKIPSRRWYMFQNMGLSPSPRSGHSMTSYGKYIVVLAGEPSSTPRDPGELGFAYVLDTSKIRYPTTDPPTAAQQQQQQQQQQIAADAARGPPPRKGSGERSGIPQGKLMARESVGGPLAGRAPEVGPLSSRLPRVAAGQAPSGPPPQQQAPQPRSNGAAQGNFGPRSKTPTKNERGVGPAIDTSRNASFERDNNSPNSGQIQSVQQENNLRNSPSLRTQNSSDSRQMNYADVNRSAVPKQSMDTVRSVAESAQTAPSRNDSRSTRQQNSLDSIERGTPRPSVDGPLGATRGDSNMPVDSGVGSSPALGQQHDLLLKELETLRSKNAWYASELAIARKSGHQQSTNNSPVPDQRFSEVFEEDDRPLLEALLKMRSELANMQSSIESQAVASANKVAEIEKQRDAAINEAVYAKAKLAALGGSQAGTPQPENERGGMGTPDLERSNDMSRRLAAALTAQTSLSAKNDALVRELESHKQARQLAEETAEEAQKRVSELESYRQENGSEVERLRAELHEAQRVAREEAANSADAKASSKLLTVDKNDLSTKLSKALVDAKTHTTVLISLREAVTASSDKASLLERKLDEERSLRSSFEQKLAQLKAEHEQRTSELEATARRLRDAEDLAEKNAAEARAHREAVLSGLGVHVENDEDDIQATDERVTILQQQVEAANAMVRQNQDAADKASEKLRRAEERIAGLEAYQEQASRESLSIRKQLQAASKDYQALLTEKSELQQQYERSHLESNALEVQLKTLKELLEERSMSATGGRSRGNGNDSPNSRFDTPEFNRIKELEEQLNASIRAHDEMRTTFENREHEVNREWEEKLTALDNDNQAAVKYLRGTEKMLSKMKQELQKYKHTNGELERDLQQARQAANAPSDWEQERESLRRAVEGAEANLKAYVERVERLEAQINQLRTELKTATQDRDNLLNQSQQFEQQQHQSRTELDALRHENAALEERVHDAETRVQMFLDQFESSVDNYRRQSHRRSNGHTLNPNSNPSTLHPPLGHRRTNTSDSVGGESLYSLSPSINPDDESNDKNAINEVDTRNSMALDSLASELDQLRSHWETTNRQYRLSDRFEFERTPTTAEFGESMATWRRRLDIEDDEGSVKSNPNEISGRGTAGAVGGGDGASRGGPTSQPQTELPGQSPTPTRTLSPPGTPRQDPVSVEARAALGKVNHGRRSPVVQGQRSGRSPAGRNSMGWV